MIEAPARRGGLVLQRLEGEAMAAYLPALAKLRIEVFRAYPYLYDGELDYESNYLQTYMRTPDSVLVVALDGDEVVGASTALPLVHETDNIVAPFRNAGFHVRNLFYFGESVLRADYRGRGVGVGFFTHREAHAAALGGFGYTCFCSVVRPTEHPLRPAHYTPLDAFWRRRGYRPLPQVTARFSWKDLDDDAESQKRMAFWIKPLPCGSASDID